MITNSMFYASLEHEPTTLHKLFDDNALWHRDVIIKLKQQDIAIILLSRCGSLDSKIAWAFFSQSSSRSRLWYWDIEARENKNNSTMIALVYGG